MLILSNISPPSPLFIRSYRPINVLAPSTGIKVTSIARQCFHNASRSCIIFLFILARMAEVLRGLHWFLFINNGLEWCWIECFIRDMECPHILINPSYLRKLWHIGTTIHWCSWTTFETINNITSLIWSVLSNNNVNLVVTQGCCCSTCCLFNWFSCRWSVRDNSWRLF